MVVEEPEINITWSGESTDAGAIERALGELDESPVVEAEPSARMATGSGPQPVDGTPLVQPADRKKALPRPSLKNVLAPDLDGDSELDVPTFIRRHTASPT